MSNTTLTLQDKLSSIARKMEMAVWQTNRMLTVTNPTLPPVDNLALTDLTQPSALPDFPDPSIPDAVSPLTSDRVEMPFLSNNSLPVPHALLDAASRNRDAVEGVAALAPISTSLFPVPVGLEKKVTPSDTGQVLFENTVSREQTIWEMLYSNLENTAKGESVPVTRLYDRKTVLSPRLYDQQTAVFPQAVSSGAQGIAAFDSVFSAHVTPSVYEQLNLAPSAFETSVPGEPPRLTKALVSAQAPGVTKAVLGMTADRSMFGYEPRTTVVPQEQGSLREAMPFGQDDGYLAANVPGEAWEQKTVTLGPERQLLLQGLAPASSVQHFVTLTPTVTVEAQISERVDIDEVVRHIERKLENEFVMAAEGVYR